MKAIDSSAFQHTYSAPALRAAGIGLSVHRATDGYGISAPGLAGSVDPTFALRVIQDKAAGIASGAYCVLELCDDPTPQVKLFLTQPLAGLVVALDVEHFWQRSGKTAAEVLAIINRAKGIIESGLGRPILIYVDLSTYEWLGKPAWQFLWIADAGAAKLPVPAAMWQSGQASIMNETVDVDVFELGDAALAVLSGQFPVIASNKPTVAFFATRSGHGYYVVAADGGVFSFGDAEFFGSLGDKTLNAPIVDGALSQGGAGYYLVGADGGVFAFGDAVFYGSAATLKLAAPITDITLTPAGYLLLAEGDGGIFAFGDAEYLGRTANG